MGDHVTLSRIFAQEYLRGLRWDGKPRLDEFLAMAEREVGRDKVGIERSAGGKVTVTIKPKDGLIATGASDATLERSRGDDGSVTIVITPRDAAPDPAPTADEF